jgi:hypothetical protein
VRVLLDHCVDRRLARLITPHDVQAAFRVGLHTLSNGRLLAAAAAAGFDALLTVDRNLRHQQNLATLPLPVVVVEVRNNQLATLVPLVPLIRDALVRTTTHRLVVVTHTGTIEPPESTHD